MLQFEQESSARWSEPAVCRGRPGQPHRGQRDRDAGAERGRRRGQGGGGLLEVGIMLKSSYNIAHPKMFPS